MGVLLAAILLFVEALLMNQNVQLFFRVVGIELIGLLFIGWVLYMIKGQQPEG